MVELQSKVNKMENDKKQLGQIVDGVLSYKALQPITTCA